MLGKKKSKKTGEAGSSKRKGNSGNARFSEFSSEMRPKLNELRNSLGLIFHNPSVVLGVFFILLVFGVAAAAPFIAPPADVNEPYQIPKDFILPPKSPGTDGLLFGSGELGIDVFYGIVWGARTTIYTSLLVVGISMFIGLILGSIAGFYGGKVDNLIMRVTDVFLALPSLILAMAVSSVLSRDINSIILALVIVWWTPYARLIRGQVMAIKENTYVEAARAIGAKKQRILFRHVVPNSLAPLMVSVTLDIGAVALTAAGLSYIGFGVDSGYAEWGRMVSDGQRWFVQGSWWTVVFPGMSILIFTMGFSLLGDGLRDIMDPRAKR